MNIARESEHLRPVAVTGPGCRWDCTFPGALLKAPTATSLLCRAESRLTPISEGKWPQITSNYPFSLLFIWGIFFVQIVCQRVTMIYVKWFLRHLHAEGGAGCQAGQAGFVTWLYLCVNVAIFPPRSPGRVRCAGKAWRCCHLVPTFSRPAPAGTRGGPLLLPLTNLRFACLSHEVGAGSSLDPWVGVARLLGGALRLRQPSIFT